MTTEFLTTLCISSIAALLMAWSFYLLFYWEGKIRLVLRLPVVNLITLLVLLILGTIEQFYLTCHPEERTKWIKSSIFQLFFNAKI